MRGHVSFQQAIPARKRHLAHLVCLEGWPSAGALAALTVGMEVPVSMRVSVSMHVIMAVCSSMFGFMTMAMILVAMAVI